MKRCASRLARLMKCPGVRPSSCRASSPELYGDAMSDLLGAAYHPKNQLRRPYPHLPQNYEPLYALPLQMGRGWYAFHHPLPQQQKMDQFPAKGCAGAPLLPLKLGPIHHVHSHIELLLDTVRGFRGDLEVVVVVEDRPKCGMLVLESSLLYL
ncbi:unnamed protein product [Chondrus crispus]|uniref:Uncharacterized protein n=1 Tax=Chondrus crispus TaxID=2769 RepID=R7QPQ5_CHOCR|nr:unnamed protein product [Chondrus crispus]CDF39375.1 unnamed protein product [Chondrus crispus]|eukprot:XP_005719286.1 unnamed protein product [Chondrus crispus]